MKSLFGLLAFALMLSLASAQYTAYFSENTSSMIFSVESLAYGGHYGNYTVSVGVFPPPISVSILGSEASAPMLAREIDYLVQETALFTPCNASMLPEGMNETYCSDSGEWGACANDLCLPRQSPLSAVSLPPLPGTQDNYAPTLPSSERAQIGASGAAQKSALSGTAGVPKQEGLGTEQVVQMFAAFFAVIVASYLVLQSRHEPLIDAATERLLENPTRAGIMEELSSADKIPTDLSNKLGKSKAAVVEHLATLSEAGLVERIATPGKKFVFYKLTQKGRQVLLRKAG